MSSSSGGDVTLSLLLVAFILLKILGIEPIASWSWWWVMSPMWIPAIIALVVIAFMKARL